jgi:hypothetical protein
MEAVVRWSLLIVACVIITGLFTMAEQYYVEDGVTQVTPQTETELEYVDRGSALLRDGLDMYMETKSPQVAAPLMMAVRDYLVILQGICGANPDYILAPPCVRGYATVDVILGVMETEYGGNHEH